jgi:hypothetical protein
MKKVKDPKTIPCFLYFDSSIRLISRPVRNIRYRRPTVPNMDIPISWEMRFSPKGPSNIPDKIKPIIPGILNLRAKSGAKRKKIRISKNTSTGS